MYIIMNRLNEIFFSTLSKEYCVYFYLMMVIFFVFLLMAMFTIVVHIVKRNKETDYLLMITNTFTLGVIYFQNRLLYSMCVN